MASTTVREGPLERLEWWLLFRGDRLVLTAGAVVVVFAMTRTLVWLDIITVGSNSYMSLVFSGVIAGLLTLVTVALTINQLILSRVFGTPKELSETLEGSRQFRRSIEDLADRHSAPTQPADFLSLIGAALYERATSLEAAVDAVAEDRQEPSGQLDDIVTEADTLREVDGDDMRGIDVLEIILGPVHAQNISTADRLQGAYADRLSEDARSDLDALSDLLEAVAIARQHYKTLLLQQTLAQLSRYITYFGFGAIVVSFFVPLLYRTSAGPMVGPEYLPWIASAGIAVSIAPLAVFLAYILRIAVVSQYTLSVGPFVPPAGTVREE